MVQRSKRKNLWIINLSRTYDWYGRKSMTYTDVINGKRADVDVFYKKVGDLKLPLQVFLPDCFDEKNKYKTVIAIHGGGWESLKETPLEWDGGCRNDFNKN